MEKTKPEVPATLNNTMPVGSNSTGGTSNDNSSPVGKFNSQHQKYKEQRVTKGKKPPIDPSNPTKQQIIMDTSKAEQQAGFNLSYGDTSLNAIKGEITKKTAAEQKKP